MKALEVLLGPRSPEIPCPINGGRGPPPIPDLVWPLGSQGTWNQACRAVAGANPSSVTAAVVAVSAVARALRCSVLYRL